MNEFDEEFGTYFKDLEKEGVYLKETLKGAIGFRFKNFLRTALEGGK